MISKKLSSSDVDWGENNSTITNKSVKNLVNQTKQRKKTTIPSSLKKKKKDSAGKETRTQRTKCNALLQPQPRSLFTSTSPRDRRALILILIDRVQIEPKSTLRLQQTCRVSDGWRDLEMRKWTCTRSGDSQQVIQFHRRARWQMVVIRQIVVWVASP